MAEGYGKYRYTYGRSFSWADTSVMCIKADNTQPRSRIITEAEADKAAGVPGRIEGLGRGIFTVFGLNGLMSLDL